MRDMDSRVRDALIWPAVILGDALIMLCFIASGFLVVQVLGGSHGDLALAGGGFGAVYVLVVHFGAWLGTRLGFRRTAIAGSVITVAAPLAFALASSVWGVGVGMGLLGLGGGIMWPNIEAELARGRRGAALRKRFSFFNTMWCFGTLVGPLLAGLIYPDESAIRSPGGRAAVNVAYFWSAGLAVGVVALLLLWRVRIPAGQETLSADHREAPPDPVKLRAFLLMSYVANLFCYIVLAVLRQLYEALADYQWKGRDPARIHSLLLVLLAGASCATFAALYFAHRWPYRIRRYVFWQAVMVGGLVLLATTASVPVAAAGFITVGVATSFFYSGSLFYSVEGRDESKHMAGWHEMIIGLGNLGGLLLAGSVPSLLRAAGIAEEKWLNRSPYLLAAALFAVGAAVQIGIYAWHRKGFAVEFAGAKAQTAR